ncbi:dihydropteroate synthase [Pseudokineococcus basanitobsidens]
MGVLNTTPDSFSDGGSWLDPAAAVRHGLAMASDGADLVDVGGESTRPGARRVDAAEERRRVLPVVRGLAAAGVAVSVDTTRAATAEAALDAGAVLVNDVSGGLADAAMAGLVAERGVPYVAMHWRGPSDVMTSLADYDDVVVEVRDELAARVEALLHAGVRPDRLVVDPGLGFAKTAEHGWALLAHLDALGELGLPLLVGASRKGMLGPVLAGPDGTPRPAVGRDDATTAVTALAAAAGVWGVRVHAVRASADAVRVAARLAEARTEGTRAEGTRTEGSRTEGSCTEGSWAHPRPGRAAPA